MIDFSSDVSEKVSIELIFSAGEHKTPEEFSVFIEKAVAKSGDRYLDTIMDYCEEKGIDPETIAKSMTPSLKDKLQAECEVYNLLKTKSQKLPE